MSFYAKAFRETADKLFVSRGDTTMIKVYATKQLGLEVYKVFLNGTLVHAEKSR
jgi:RPA family protein